MTPERERSVLGVLGMLTVACGVLAWAWLRDWRWAVSGAAALLVIAAVGAALDRRQ